MLAALASGAGRETTRHTGADLTSLGVTRRQRAAHPGQLLLRGHLLGDQSGLDAVEQPLEPADQLRLRDPQLGVAGRARPERQRDPVELLDELGRQPCLLYTSDAADE